MAVRMAKIVREALPALLKADDGAAAIEYGLLATLIACVLLFSLAAVGSTLDQKLSQLASGLGAQSGGPGGGGNNGRGGNGNGNNGNGNGNGGPAGGSGA
jgi:Flp pilus assembly pilin Flp